MTKCRHVKKILIFQDFWHACFLLFWQSAFVHNTQFAVNATPVSEGRSPFFRCFKGSQIQSLHQSRWAGKYASLRVQAAVGTVQTFDGIGRINNFSDISRRLENRADSIPVGSPTFHSLKKSALPPVTNGIFYISFPIYTNLKLSQTECIYRHKPAPFQKANEMIDRYIHFYNHERIQLRTGVVPFTIHHST